MPRLEIIDPVKALGALLLKAPSSASDEKVISMIRQMPTDLEDKIKEVLIRRSRLSLWHMALPSKKLKKGL